MKKSILILLCLLLFNISKLLAGTWVVGVNQVNDLLSKIEQGTGNIPPAIPTTTNKSDWELIDGITLTSEDIITTYLDHSNTNNHWRGFYALNFANKGYKQKSGTAIKLIQPSLSAADYTQIPTSFSSLSDYWDRNDLSWLEIINLTGNDFTNIEIDGHNIMPLKTFSIADNAHLENLAIKNCTNLTNVDITGCNLTFSAISNLQNSMNLSNTATFLYENQGKISSYFNAVDLTELLEKNGNGTRIKSWSIQPIKNEGNIYTFDSSHVGEVVRVYLENSNFPNMVISYDINLTNTIQSTITTNATFCKVKVENLTTGNSSIFSIGDEALITVYPYSCSILESFTIDGVSVSLDSKNQYQFTVNKSNYQISSIFKRDDTPMGQTSNYLRNGSFEYGLNLDWEYNIGEGTSAEFMLERGSNVIDGNVALRVDINSLKTPNSVYAKTHVTVGCDSLYLLHFWAKGPEESKLYVQIDGAEQNGIQYELHEGNTAFYYPFKLDRTKAGEALTITFYFQDDFTKVKVSNPCSVTTSRGATYFLDGLELVDQFNNLSYDVYNTYVWNYNHRPNKEGKMWVAGDNSVSYDLPDGRKMWFFNDSFYGVMHPESNRLVDVGQFVRNAVVVQNTDGSLVTYPVTNQGGQWAYFRVPDDAVIYNTDGSVKNIFWVGDAIMEDNQIKIYLIEVYGEGRSYIGKFTYPGLEFLGVEKQENFCRAYETFFVEDNKIYLYKTENEGNWGRYMHVARADLGDLSGKKGSWEFWNGTEWSKDSTQTARIYDMMSDGIIRLENGNYAHVSMPLMSPEVYVSFAPAPQGPWTNKKLVAVGDKSANYWYYMPNFNGKLPNGKYAISFSANYNYCLFFCKECETSSFVDKYWYRPRFIQVDLLAMSPYTKNPKDCAGVENGSAFYDTCGHCVGGTTGIEPCLSGVAKIYTHANYSGTGIGLNAGEYTANHLLSLGFETNALSSFNLNSGYAIELYSEDNFQGEMKEFENSVIDLSEKSFDNQTKSLIIRRKGIENISGVYAIQNKQSQLYLDVEGSSTANNALIIQSSYNNNDSQKFRLNHLGKGVYTVENIGSEKYLNIVHQSKEPKSFVEQWDGKEYDIILNGGEITSQYSDSPTGLDVTKLIDRNTATKYITFHNKAWIQFKSSGTYILGRYCLTSANDAPARDPSSWTISGSNDGINWTEIDSQSGIIFDKRFEEKSFNVNSDASYSYFKIEITCNSGSVLQFAELKLFGKTNVPEGDYSDSQKFIVQDAGNDFVKLINKNSDLMLEIVDGFTNEGENVWQNTDFGQLGGLWKLIDPNSLSNGVETVVNNKNILIYPNPVSDYISIESTASEIINKVLVTDLSGRIIQNKTYNDKKLVISLSDLRKGLYLLKIITDKNSYGHIIIKN
jgi:hypothetical protein